MTRIFISHSHSDDAIADLLIDFLGEAMEISKKDIRCTSDPNHGLDFSSSSISDQLKKDLKNAEALIVIATIDSLRSPWILFEVGSFWTTDKLVAPIIGPGLTFDDLPGPLKGYRSIQIEKEDPFYELGELINQLTARLKVKQIGISRRRDNKLRAFIKNFRAWKSQSSAIAKSQEREKLEARIQELERDLSEARSQLESQERSHSQELQDQAQENNLKIQELEQELSKARSQLAQVQESARDLTVEASRAQKEQFEKELAQKDDEIMRLREKLVERSKNIESGNAQYFKEQLGNNVELEMIAIPSSTFLMGSPEGEGRNSEKPQHKVNVQAFYMGKYPITQAQYQQIMGKNPSEFKGNDQRSVENVSWDDAVEFCKKLSKQTGNKYRLSTEAEWEYACRAQTTTAYYFGESITKEQVNYRETVGYSPVGTTPVGKFPPNDFGLYDMHGNVWEWCQDDWHDSYKNAPNNGSAWLSEETTKVIRGGSWNDNSDVCRSAIRLSGDRDNPLSIIGFRVVHVAPKTTYTVRGLKLDF